MDTKRWDKKKRKTVGSMEGWIEKTQEQRKKHTSISVASVREKSWERWGRSKHKSVMKLSFIRALNRHCGNKVAFTVYRSVTERTLTFVRTHDRLHIKAFNGTYMKSA